MDIFVTVLIAGLLLLVEHWFPWEMLFKRKLHNLAKYILGVLALVGPLAILFVVWEDWRALIALCCCVVFGGLAVVLAYVIDRWNEVHTQCAIYQGESAALRGEIDGKEI